MPFLNFALSVTRVPTTILFFPKPSTLFDGVPRSSCVASSHLVLAQGTCSYDTIVEEYALIKLT
ncbi:hypothetical protein LB506_008782 [Fusarium annulatum]|nr:hypothetical protein LB506_008782 [Fusarium annulatum]